MDARMKMLALLQARRTEYSLEQEFYVDTDFFRLDLEAIHYREWLFVGHDCELAKPGSFFTVEIGAYSAIIVRGLDHTIRAYHNICRHRGSRICSAESGRLDRLVCPYHQWVYELDGRLAHARTTGPQFDLQRFGLKPIHCGTVGGYIFVCLAETAPEFGPIRQLIEKYFAPHRLSEAKVAHVTTIVEKGNWKLVWENNRECYHCAAKHPELCRTFTATPTVTGAEGAVKDPWIVDHWDHCRKAGLPSGFEVCEGGQCRVTRMPLLRDAVSFTSSGRAACRRPLSDSVPEPRIGSMVMFHYPSIWNHVLGDHATSFRVLPLGPTETQLTTKWLVHKDAVEGVDYDLDELTKVWIATNDQDLRIVEENQRGIRSPAYEPGPYVPEHEDGVMQFVEWYCKMMARHIGTPSERLDRVARTTG